MSGMLGRLAPTGRLAAAIAWRWLWAGDDRRRGLVWGNQRGFDLRPRPAKFVSVTEPRNSRTESRSTRLPRSSCMGVIAIEDGPDTKAVMAEVGHFYGLEVFRAAPDHAGIVIDCAVRERWPLLSVALEGIDAVPEQWPMMLRAFVSRGGTLLLNGILPGSTRSLGAISDALGIELPAGQALVVPASEVVFSAEDRTFAGELAGVGFPVSPCDSALTDHSGAVTLVSARSGTRLFPAVTDFVVGAGRVVVSAGTQVISRLADAMNPVEALKMLPPLMLVRQVYGQAAWRAPVSFANFVIDDPALRTGRLGLDYPRALALAREHGFHLTVATIPRELDLAEPMVVELLRRNDRWLSACYHGNDHSGYEFYLPRARDSRYPARSLSAQMGALRQAVARGESFAARTGLALDRVMVFPHGIGPSQIFSTMQSLGFISACNFDDRYPLGESVPLDFDLGMRPADLAWGGFPLIWRRGLPDQLFRLDLFLGRPAITFGHARAVGADLDPFVQRAAEIHRIGGGHVRWSSLEDISRHSYLQRHDPELGWRVLMLSNEICLHNPDAMPRMYHVERTNIPAGYSLRADGADERPDGALNITVPAEGVRTIRLTGSDARTMTPGRSCSLQDVWAQRSSA